MVSSTKPQWCTQRVSCDACGHVWVEVVPIKTMGKECPACGFYDAEFVSYGLVWLAQDAVEEALNDMYERGGKDEY